MSREYWQQREEETLAFRDYGLAFDLAKDLAGGVDLAESGDQLLEITFQLAFLGRADEGLALAGKAVDYYQAALTRESRTPMTDPRVAHVYHGLYYARWWTTGQEPLGLLRQAAGAFVASLGQPPDTGDFDLYLKAARLWLEQTEVEQAEGWLHLAEWAASQAGPDAMPPDLPLVRLLVQAQRCQATTEQACVALQSAITAATAWGRSGTGTFWNALQLANIRRRQCGSPADLPDLLAQIC